MVREAKRKSPEYKRNSTAELAKYLTAFPSVNLFGEVKKIVGDGLVDLTDEDDSDLQMKPMYSDFSSVLMVAAFLPGVIYIRSHPPVSNQA